MARRNRIGNTERLIMALRDPDGDFAGIANREFLETLKTFIPFYNAIIGPYFPGRTIFSDSSSEKMEAVANLIEEAMERE